MRTKIGLLIALCFLAYGLIRIGVGSALLAQAQGLIAFDDLAKAVGDVKTFIDARIDKQIVAFSVSGYFIYIFIMGVILVAGAIGTLFYKRWGTLLLVVYLTLHGALFVDFQEINPKIIGFIIQIVMLIVLTYLRPSKIAMRASAA